MALKIPSNENKLSVCVLIFTDDSGRRRPWECEEKECRFAPGFLCEMYWCLQLVLLPCCHEERRADGDLGRGAGRESPPPQPVKMVWTKSSLIFPKLYSIFQWSEDDQFIKNTNSNLFCSLKTKNTAVKRGLRHKRTSSFYFITLKIKNTVSNSYLVKNPNKTQMIFFWRLTFLYKYSSVIIFMLPPQIN